MLEYNDDTPKPFAVWASANIFSESRAPAFICTSSVRPSSSCKSILDVLSYTQALVSKKEEKNYSPPIKLRCDKFFSNVKLYKI